MKFGPRTRFVLETAAFFVLFGSLLRLTFYFTFGESARDVRSSDLWSAFYVGVKFDARMAMLLAVPYLALSRIPWINPVRGAVQQRFWVIQYTIAGAVLLSLYVADLGHYGYLGDRLNASAIRFLGDPLISARMMWETYPVIWGALIMSAVVAGMFFWFRSSVARCARQEMPVRRGWARVGPVLVVVALICGPLYGKFSYYPLRWSDAFLSPDRFTSDLGLNPILYFADTLAADEPAAFDEDATREMYPIMAAYLGVEQPDAETLDFVRHVRSTPLGTETATPPNIVVILMESFAAHHCGSFGNPLNPSPNFDRLSKEGIVFTNFFTPRVGTARAVFTSIVGLPDMMSKGTATRNPAVISQETVFGALDGYDKHYFLGGSANWANIRGLLRNNIRDLQIHEEGSYDSPRVDVWGISDLHLFEEANKIFRKKNNKPFVAFIHCSGNHGPYTIPEDRRGFELREVDQARLVAHGFEEIAEFNSFRFLDHSVGWFIETARKEEYFKNTVFLLYGDNGTEGRTDHMPPSSAKLGLGRWHTPLLILAPGRIAESLRISSPAGQADVMATVAGITGVECRNTALGRNLLDPRFGKEAYAFARSSSVTQPKSVLIGERYVYSVNMDGSNPLLRDRTAKDPLPDVSASEPALFKRMGDVCRAYFETARWMLHHNRPDKNRPDQNRPDQNHADREAR